MSANLIFLTGGRWHGLCLRLLWVAVLTFSPAAAFGDDVEEAEMAVAKLMQPLEKAGYDFRADVWERELSPDVGKAVRLQLFKGNEYRVCIAVSERSGVKINARVLDGDGETVDTAADNRGWGVVLTVKPKRTGIYVVAINQAGGRGRTVTCAMIMGYR